jgi:hypothetical protein
MLKFYKKNNNNINNNKLLLILLIEAKIEQYGRNKDNKLEIIL